MEQVGQVDASAPEVRFAFAFLRPRVWLIRPHQIGDRPAVPGDDNALATFDPLEQLAELFSRYGGRDGHESSIERRIDVNDETREAIGCLAEAIVALEKRVGRLESGQIETDQAMRNSLDAIRAGMAGIMNHIRNRQPPRQPPGTARLN